jgi:hypothetical protein
MHRYNNQDHSMLAANSAVSSIIHGRGKESIWLVNAESDYHEEIAEPLVPNGTGGRSRDLE